MSDTPSPRPPPHPARRAQAERPVQARAAHPDAAGPAIRVGGREVVNFCANNYLGLANHPDDRRTPPTRGSRQWGYGLSSRAVHLRHAGPPQASSKQQIAKFFGKDDSILYISCFDANGGLFEPLLGEQDAILSDELNHASIIDGVRLCKAQRFRYKHNDMADLKAKLEEAKGCRFKLIFTDSVFSMDGDLAKLPDICDLADQYDAAGRDRRLPRAPATSGATGRGAAEELGVLDRIDVITSTLGKTLGGASGGFTAARAEVVDWLRNRSRPYLFSNSVPPALVVAGMKALELIGRRRRAADEAARRTRSGCGPGWKAAGFTLKPGPTPILPVMLGDAARRHEDGRRAARARHLRDRLQLPGGAAGAGPHPHPGVGGPHGRADRPGDRGVHRGGKRTRDREVVLWSRLGSLKRKRRGL